MVTEDFPAVVRERDRPDRDARESESSTSSGDLEVLRERKTAISPTIAAKESHIPGIARFPVFWIRYVQIAGVNPPKIAVARL